ncbi:MAG: error-prone DNA polymerase, partial [Myxococcota bacterium]
VRGSHGEGTLTFLCAERAGWARLSRWITDARGGGDAEAPRVLPSVPLRSVLEGAPGLVVLAGGRGGLLDRAPDEAARDRLVGRLAEAFPGATYLTAQDHDLVEDVPRVTAVLAQAKRLALPWVATGEVRHAAPQDKAVQDALVCLGHRTTLAEAGDRLFPNDGRHLRGPGAMARRWAAAPAGLLRTLEVAERCTFDLRRDLRPTLPTFTELKRHDLPREAPERERGELIAGEVVRDPDALLAARARAGFRARYAEPTARHESQLQHELLVIRRLGLAGYFLIVADIAAFARHRGILAQGRGSAANSVVCFCLGITAVDPVGMELLFERFLSEGRGEAPDIDIDIAHRDREEVLQYVYDRYGRTRAAMVCETITWRGRSAVRDAARVLGLPPEVADRLAERVGHRVPSDAPTETLFTGGATAGELLAGGGIEAAGLDPRSRAMRALLRLVRGLEGLPRHRGIHVGGFVLTGEPLAEIVPIEPAAMEGRTVIQWDKDDLGPMGLVKIDLLGLGILTLLGDALRHVNGAPRSGATPELSDAAPLTLESIPAGDPATYALIQTADTVGVFQIESRAQMNVLPRTRPERFYDLVVQVALIRPGPIQGEMVHPYMRRRRGEEPVSYLHPVLEPVLRRTLGVPLFQEQGMKVAVAAAGFSPAQADALRRAMGSKRSRHKMARLSLELLQGMEARGIAREVGERIVKQLAAFASYGFPESHAASFALLVYTSAYLKANHAPAFYAAILDAQPMGFYPVGSLVADAKRHGVEVRGPCVNRSGWLSVLEAAAAGGRYAQALRLGLRLVSGLGAKASAALEAALAERPFRSIAHFTEVSGLPRRALAQLARAGAFDTLAGDRRQALWRARAAGRLRGGPLDAVADDRRHAPLTPPSAAERVLEDYATVGASAEAHPIAFLARRRQRAGIPTLGELASRRPGPVRVVGLVNSRQRPATAKGFVFLSLEDETGMANVVVRPDLFEREADVITKNPVLLIEGVLEVRQGVVNVIARRFQPVRKVPGAGGAGSHDFH